MRKAEKNNTAANRQEALKELTEQLEQSIRSFMSGETYRNFLSKMSRFHSYSLNNQLLIAMQRPDATLCASYSAWKKQGRQVKKGEAGIKIICPAPYKAQVLEDIIDPKTEKPEHMEDGSTRQAVVEKIIPFYKIGYTFDVSQTEGEPLPELTKKLEGDLDNTQKDLKDALLQICPVPVHFKPIPGNANGYYNLMQKEIVIDSTLSEKHALKTLIHEMAHAKLHDNDIPDAPQDSSTREIQAESIAYVVCHYFGLDTSDFTFGYISGWSSGKDTLELKNSLETIRSTSNDIISDAEQFLEKIRTQKHITLPSEPIICKGRCR